MYANKQLRRLPKNLFSKLHGNIQMNIIYVSAVNASFTAFLKETRL